MLIPSQDVHFPVDPELQKFINANYESDEVLGAVHNQMRNLIEMIDADELPHQRGLRDRTVRAMQAIRAIIEEERPGFIKDLQRAQFQAEEQKLNRCMAL